MIGLDCRLSCRLGAENHSFFINHKCFFPPLRMLQHQEEGKKNSLTYKMNYNLHLQAQHNTVWCIKPACIQHADMRCNSWSTQHKQVNTFQPLEFSVSSLTQTGFRDHAVAILVFSSAISLGRIAQRWERWQWITIKTRRWLTADGCVLLFQFGCNLTRACKHRLDEKEREREGERDSAL